MDLKTKPKPRKKGKKIMIHKAPPKRKTTPTPAADREEIVRRPSQTRTSNTLQAKLGFNDPDLRSSKHDELMLWADANALAIARRVFGVEHLEIEEKVWEQPVTAARRNGFIVGFIDLWVTCCCTHPHHGTEYDAERRRDERGRTEEIPTKKSIMAAGHRDKCQSRRFRLAIEVKATMPTLGELIRQVQMYRQPRMIVDNGAKINTAHFVIVTPDPDPTHVELLRSQNISVIDSTRDF